MILVVGPSQSGKSSLFTVIIKQNIYEKKIISIKWCYSVCQKWFIDEPYIIFESGIPEDFQSVDLVILDDLMHNLQDNVSKLFTICSHHNIDSYNKFYKIYSLNQNL